MQRVERDEQEEERHKDLVRQEKAGTFRVVLVEFDVTQLDSEVVPEYLAGIGEKHSYKASCWGKQELLFFHFTALLDFDCAEDPRI